MGDVKLSAFLGAGLGIAVDHRRCSSGSSSPSSPRRCCSCATERTRGSEAIPLGPFLALGGVIALFWGHAILDWYQDLGRQWSRTTLQRDARGADIRLMDSASAAARVVRPIDVALLAAAATAAVDAIGDGEEPARSIEGAVDAFYDAVAGVMPSVFVLEHGRTSGSSRSAGMPSSPTG